MLLKRLALIIFPGLGTLYFLVGVIFGFHWMIWVLGGFLVLILYLGILVMATSGYNGQIVITQSESGKRVFTLELETDPEDITEMESITFQVVNQMEIRSINMPYNEDYREDM
jgi:hypothetical protein